MIQINIKKPVLVTGATGYLAGEIIKQLLEKGIPVHATVRDRSKKEKYAHLDKIAKDNGETITYFNANLLKEGAFDEAIQGCELVIHTASPFVMKVKNPQKELIDPAVKGVKNLFSAVKKSTSIKRVVITSSIYSVYGDNIDAKDSHNNTVDEGNWNTSSSLQHQAYAYSKVLAEQEAWEVTNKQTKWDLISINPGFILGPATNPHASFESKSILCQFGDGTYQSGVPKINMGIVDIRNVAEAHIKAGLSPKAKGRYILVAETMDFIDFAQILKENFSGYPFPKGKAPKWLVWLIAPMIGLTRKFVSRNVNHPLKINNQKSIKELNIDYIQPKESICSFFQQLIDHEQITVKR